MIVAKKSCGTKAIDSMRRPLVARDELSAEPRWRIVL
jgi:hypothetical protein